MVPSSPSARSTGLAAVVGGLIIVVIGLAATVDADVVGDTWFAAAAVAAALFVVGLLGRRSLCPASTGVARPALLVAAGAFALFALAHVYAIADEDAAVLLFSVFMVIGALALVVAGIALVRAGAGHGWRRGIVLVCGAWPLATVPAGAAIGDVPHFLAITVWGALWIALGASVVTALEPRPARPAAARAATTTSG